MLNNTGTEIKKLLFDKEYRVWDYLEKAEMKEKRNT